jgi:VanZ family protein
MMRRVPRQSANRPKMDVALQPGLVVDELLPPMDAMTLENAPPVPFHYPARILPLARGVAAHPGRQNHAFNVLLQFRRKRIEARASADHETSSSRHRSRRRAARRAWAGLRSGGTRDEAAIVNEMGGEVRRITLWLLVLVNVVAYWYPFSVDFPRYVENTARQLPDGSLAVDRDSRVAVRVPGNVLSADGNRPYSLTLRARPTVANQTGPARLLAVSSDPYQASLMVGLDHGDVVVRLPCDEAGRDAEWTIPWGGSPEVVVTLWPLGDARGTGPRVQVNRGRQVELEHQCPTGQRARLFALDAPWSIGNVASGHRPFVGQILELALAAGDRRVDLLREVPLEAPASFWRWPERLYQPAAAPVDEPIEMLWHFVGFFVLGYLLAAGTSPPAVLGPLLIAVGFSGTLFVGKFFVAGRHPSPADVALNLAGAAAGILLCRALRRQASTNASGQ